MGTEGGTDPIDEAAVVDMVDSLQEVTDALDELNNQATELTFAMQSYPSYNSSETDPEPIPHESCKDLDKKTSVTAPSQEFLIGAAAAYILTSGIHDQCDSASNQDVLGNNGSAVCVVTATAKAIAYDVWEYAELLYDMVTSEQVENLTKCAATLSAGLKGVGDKVDEIDKKIDALKELMIERFDQVETLLNTPQGQRPNFPTK
jgi:hypothetical protein